MPCARIWDGGLEPWLEASHIMPFDEAPVAWLPWIANGHGRLEQRWGSSRNGVPLQPAMRNPAALSLAANADGPKR